MIEAGFYIHGRGTTGATAASCRRTHAKQLRLNKAVKNADSAALLEVADPGMPPPAERGIRYRYA